MLRFRSIYFIFFYGILCILLCSQSSEQKEEFASPIDFPILLAGNFGEIRNNHFHSGIDIKTESVEGKRLFSIADGYVSRIKVSPIGYGKTLYVTHANGYTSVYAHLQGFNDEIELYLKKMQYRRRTYSIDLYLAPDQIKVKRGDVIAYSGNSGSSEGPHLHFEIRDTKAEDVINPMLFNFVIPDSTPPTIYSIMVYPHTNSYVQGRTISRRIPVKKINNNYVPYLNDTLFVYGDIGFGIEAIDYVSGSYNQCGIYSATLKIDSQEVFSFTLNRFAFGDTRYCNSHIDFKEFIQKRKNIHKCFVQPNNKLPIYKNVVNGGIYKFSDNKTHHILITVSDVSGNRVTAQMYVKSLSQKPSNAPVWQTKCEAIMPYQKANYFKNEDIEIILPTMVLYDTLFFEYSNAPRVPNSFSKVHNIHHTYTPLHKNITISINANQVPERLYDKTLIASVDYKGHLSAIGGSWTDGYVSVQYNKFGRFAIAIDTIPPNIKALNLRPNMSGHSAITFIVSDNFSGVDSFDGFIDNQWVLFEEPKKGVIRHYFDETIIEKNKNHTFKLIVTDKKNNKTEYNAEFYW